MFACEIGDKKRPANSRTRMVIKGKKRRMIAYKGSDKGKILIKRQNFPDAKTSSENLRYHSPTLSNSSLWTTFLYTEPLRFGGEKIIVNEYYMSRSFGRPLLFPVRFL
jgi:hypothetical protein